MIRSPDLRSPRCCGPTHDGSAPAVPRRAVTRVAHIALAVAALGGGLAAGCSHDARPAAEPVAAAEQPPLPSASGSPIGFLLDDTRLTLNDDQRSKLKDIDTELAGKLAYLDTVLRNAGTTAAPDKTDSKGGFGFSAAGGRDHQDGTQDGAKLSSATGTTTSSGLTMAQAAENAGTVKRIPIIRARDVHEAIVKALALLTADQQKIARTVLVERGIDPDTGQTEAKGEPGSARDPSK